MDATVAPSGGSHTDPVREARAEAPSLPPHATASGADDGADQRDFLQLFERARRALTSQLQLEPGIAEALAMPGHTVPPPVAPGRDGPLAAQLTMDDRTRRVVVRLIDVRTGATIREVPSTVLATVAARIGRVVAGRTGPP
jgi:hypothetical protein